MEVKIIPGTQKKISSSMFVLPVVAMPHESRLPTWCVAHGMRNKCIIGFGAERSGSVTLGIPIC